MKKLKLFISLWFTMFSIVMFGQAEYEKIAITQNTQDNTAGRLLVQDVTTGEVRWILKSILDNKFNQPTGDATQYLDGAGNPTTFPVLSQSDRVITEVRNSTGATITKGTVVYLNGATGGKPNVQKAQANAEATSSGTFGVIQSDINNNSNGYVVVIGTVLGLNTSAYTAGQVLWLSPTTAGGYTTTKPVAPNHAVYVGIVTLAATQGTIEVKIQNGYELDEIHDVLITSKTDNDGLIYESSSGLWKNKQITKAMVGLANVDNTSDLNKPISTATQTALNLKENTANKNTANGYAGLGSDGKLISSQLPAITITDTFVVGSQAAMLALTAETGDVAVRTDVNKSFILKGSSAGTLADWQELLTPTSSVTSVFGRQGAVTANNGDYTTALVTETTNKRYQTDIQQTYNDATSSIQTQLNSKANDNAVVHLAGTESVTGAKTFTSTPSFDSNIYLKKTGSWANPANYSVIGGMTNGFFLSSGTNKHAYLDLFQLTQARQYDFPDKSGTFAMTSDVPTISGTTNYVTKFTGASALGNSVIFDDGTNLGIGTASPLTGGGSARWITANGTASYSGGFIGSINGAAKMYLYSESGFAKLQGTTSEGVKLEVNGGTTALTALSSGKVGIGTASPIYKFHVNDTSDGIVGHFSGGVSNYTLISFLSNEPNVYSTSLGSYNSGLLFRTGASDRMYINSSGKVGIGTISPTAKLNVSGDLGASVGNGNSAIKLINSDTGNYASIGAGIVGTTNEGMQLSTDGVSRIVISSSGSVGIGTTAPVQKLHVEGASYFASDMFTAQNGGIFFDANGSYSSGIFGRNFGDDLAMNAGGQERLRINSTGNVGIGTATQTSGLEIDRSSWSLNGSTVSRMMQKYVGGAGDYEQHVILLHPIYNGTLINYNKAAGTIYATRGGSSMGLINDSYDFDTASAYNSTVGTANSKYGYGRLYTCLYNGVKYMALIPDYRTSAVEYNFDGYIRSTGEKLKVVNYRMSNSGTVLNSEINNSLTLFSPGTSYVQGGFYVGSDITAAGNVTAVGFYQSSDLRLKDIISRDGDVIKYKWKDKRDDKIHIGYVAQEVQKENPDQVNADDKGILSVNYIEILVQKIKDLENRIKQLEK